MPIMTSPTKTKHKALISSIIAN